MILEYTQFTYIFITFILQYYNAAVCFVFRLCFTPSHLKVSVEPEQDSVLNSKKLTSNKKLYFVLLNYIRVIDSLPGRKAERSPPPTKPTPIAISC